MLAKIIVPFCHDVGVYDFSVVAVALHMLNSTACTNAPRFLFNIYSMRQLYGEAVAVSGIIVALLTFAFVSHFEMQLIFTSSHTFGPINCFGASRLVLLVFFPFWFLLLLRCELANGVLTHR